MEASDKRKVKRINGWKVNHPFSFGNMFYAFLTLGLVAVPLVYIFTPIISVIDGNPPKAVPFIQGVELLTGFFNNMDMFRNPSEKFQFIFALGGEKLFFMMPYILYVQFGLLSVMMLLSLIAFIVFMINICRGYLRHARIVRALAVWQFLFSLLFASTFLVIYIYIFIVLGGFPNIFIWWTFVIAGSLLIWMIMTCIAYSKTYKEVIFEADLEYHTDGEKEVVTHVTEVHNVTKVNYEPANELPPNLTSIGGHAFSENQYLEIANIPVGVTSLGGGAFANCLKLKVVSLPEDVKEIGYNCFFNCVSLERINYAGSKEQWRHIRRGSNWLAKAKTTKVICIDGPIVVNPYH